MTICERMFKTMDDKGLRASALCRVLGIGTNITTGWKKRNADPPAKYIAQICEFLDCSLEYLLTGSEKEPQQVELSENSREMLKLYELLPEREQLILLGRLQEMAAPLHQPAQEKQNPASSKGKVG